MVVSDETAESSALDDLGHLLHGFDTNTSLDIDLSLASIVAATTSFSNYSCDGNNVISGSRSSEDQIIDENVSAAGNYDLGKLVSKESQKSVFPNACVKRGVDTIKTVAIIDDDGVSSDDDVVGNPTQTQSSVQTEDFVTICESDKTCLPKQAEKKEKWKLRLNELLKIKKQLLCVNNGKSVVKELNVSFLKAMKLFGNALKIYIRPCYLQEDIEAYALQIVVVGEKLTAIGSKAFARSFPLMLNSLISYWTRPNVRDIQLSRSWHHTRGVISLMLRHISSINILLAVEKVFTTLQMRFIQCKTRDTIKVVCAIREVHVLQDVLVHQLAFVGNLAV